MQILKKVWLGIQFFTLKKSLPFFLHDPLIVNQLNETNKAKHYYFSLLHRQWYEMQHNIVGYHTDT